MWGVKGNLFELTKPRGVQFCGIFLFLLSTKGYEIPYRFFFSYFYFLRFSFNQLVDFQS